MAWDQAFKTCPKHGIRMRAWDECTECDREGFEVTVRGRVLDEVERELDPVALSYRSASTVRTEIRERLSRLRSKGGGDRG